MMFSLKKPIAAMALFALSPMALVSTGAAFGQKAEVGASLNQKVSVPLSEVPAEVLAVVRAKRPGMKVAEAEKEIRSGNQYFDIEGIDANGNEIELDLTLEGGVWAVVEIQRDISWDMVPGSVQTALHDNVPGVSPDRIIESDQDNGMIIYEFFTRNVDGGETKYEVALEAGEATFLNEEWKH
jgi:hypothetical protein